MKILYLPIMNTSDLHPSEVGDYLCDTIFHGLRSFLGEGVVDAPRLWHLYKRDFEEKPEMFKDLSGKGFTTYGLLPDLDIDRSDLFSKVKNKYYDYIICPLHHSQSDAIDNNAEHIHEMLDDLLEIYPKNKIAILDGRERKHINTSISKKVTYFKRELSEELIPHAFSISFSIPKEKICEPMDKSFDFAPLIPAFADCDDPHEKSYIYENEKEYYADYQKSYFAFTCKKAREDALDEGWDCMRHYEILACGCVPFFTDIELCPRTTLERFPKELCIQAKNIEGVYPGTKIPYAPHMNPFIGTSKMILPGEERGRIDFDRFDEKTYLGIRDQLHEYTKTRLTTKNEAQRLLGILENL